MAIDNVDQFLVGLSSEMEDFHKEIKEKSKNELETFAKKLTGLGKELENTPKELRAKVKAPLLQRIRQAAQDLSLDNAVIEEAGILEVNFFIQPVNDFQETLKNVFQQSPYFIDKPPESSGL